MTARELAQEIVTEYKKDIRDRSEQFKKDLCFVFPTGTIVTGLIEDNGCTLDYVGTVQGISIFDPFNVRIIVQGDVNDAGHNDAKFYEDIHGCISFKIEDIFTLP